MLLPVGPDPADALQILEFRQPFSDLLTLRFSQVFSEFTLYLLAYLCPAALIVFTSAHIAPSLKQLLQHLIVRNRSWRQYFSTASRCFNHRLFELLQFWLISLSSQYSLSSTVKSRSRWSSISEYLLASSGAHPTLLPQDFGLNLLLRALLDDPIIIMIRTAQ